MSPEWDGEVEKEEQNSQADLGPSGPDTAQPATDSPAGETEPPSDVGSSPPGDADETTEETEPGQDDEVLPKDVQYDILKNRRRRLVLRYLFEEDNPASLGTLSEYVAGVENGKDPRQLDSQERKRAYVGLYQCHLPRMHDAGVIEFNKDRGMVSQGPHTEELMPHVQQDDDAGDGWARVYLSSSLLGLGAYLITESFLLDVDWLGMSVLGLTLVGIAAISTFQLKVQHDKE